ncbi:hypothetical protein J2751_000072 [Halorubrum alkaliphilum]|uniref:SHOCT domain-containing protein n=1 Tax=Halorubrum alkaliphilum TaxID=261290 RepID=A0A8T4GBI2_9EURY|nr:SHOCT domain-containing protein [Halorubrum alkaliphilum]MBP1921089.1 hypothetical protein [Halorubrum alkaliphilum]
MPSTTDTAFDRLRQSIEEYTPDGTVGRLALAAVAAPVAGFSLFLAAGFFLAPAPISLLIVPLTAAFGGGLSLLAVLTIWPVYLSAIGRVDSPPEYSRAIRDRPSNSRTDRVKRKYREGSISEAELESELDTILDSSNDEPPSTDADSEGGRPAQPDRTEASKAGETERNG